MPTTTITPLSTGRVAITHAMRRGRGTGLARRRAMLTDRSFTDPLPIHAWLIAHGDELLLIDTGELATVRDVFFARFSVTREDEIDLQLERAGVKPAELSAVVLTHVHGDHADGLARLRDVPTLVSERELASVRSVGARVTRRMLHQPLPAGFAPAAFAWDGPAIGAFPRSHALTADGAVAAVPLPGHTPGQIGVLIDRADHQVLICGDAAYTEAQILDLHPDGVSPDPAVSRATMETILRHAALHPTVVLPSHDPESVERLEALTVMDAQPAAAAAA